MQMLFGFRNKKVENFLGNFVVIRKYFCMRAFDSSANISLRWFWFSSGRRKRK